MAEAGISLASIHVDRHACGTVGAGLRYVMVPGAPAAPPMLTVDGHAVPREGYMRAGEFAAIRRGRAAARLPHAPPARGGAGRSRR